MKYSDARPRGSRRPRWWWTTVKGSRRAARRPWRWSDSTPRSVKLARQPWGDR